MYFATLSEKEHSLLEHNRQMISSIYLTPYHLQFKMVVEVNIEKRD